MEIEEAVGFALANIQTPTVQQVLNELDAPTSPAPDDLELTETIVRPRKSDISIKPLMVAWTPWTVDRDGIAEKAF